MRIPLRGPQYTFQHHGVNGWDTQDRWYFTKAEQDNGPNKGIFSGIDYMILLNLYYICNVVGCTSCPVPYHNMDNSILDKEWPQGNNGSISQPLNVNSFRSITSTEKIHIIPLQGDVNYYAGKTIKLEAGFNVEKGATFTAAIRPMDYCSSGSYVKVDTADLNQNSNAIGIDNRDDINGFVYANYFTKDEQENNGLIIYPNPSDGNISIKNTHSISYELIIESVTGTIISDTFYDSQADEKVDISNFTPGVYIFKLLYNYKLYI